MVTDTALVEVIPNAILVSADIINLTCKENNNGSIILHVSGGSPYKTGPKPYIISIKKKSSVVSHISSDKSGKRGVRSLMVYNDTISNLEEGEYEVTITDSLPTQVVKTYTLTAPPVISAIGTTKQASSALLSLAQPASLRCKRSSELAGCTLLRYNTGKSGSRRPTPSPRRWIK